MESTKLIGALEEYAQEGLYAIPAKASLWKDGTKKVFGTMPHANGDSAIRSGSDWSASRARILEHIETRGYNFLAIKTGAISDCFVLDVDVKDKQDEDILAGMPYWQSLIEEHGEPDTLRATTASGGLHYYFSFSSTIKEGLESGKNFVGLDVDGQVYGIDGRVVMDRDVIIEAGGRRSAESASSHVMALKGARLAESDESGEKSVLNESTIKELSGGGSITARELQGRQETFMVTHKAILNTNYKPVMENASFSLIRRMALLPMMVTFKSAESLNPNKSREKAKDSTLEAYLKSDEGREDGLSWIAAGASRYFEIKRAKPSALVLEKRPKAMEDALKAYVNDADVAKRFIEECLEFEELHPGQRATWHLAGGERLQEAFQTWIKEEDVSSSITATALKKRVVLYADGGNHQVATGRFTDKKVQLRGQFKGLSGVRLRPEFLDSISLV
ncbi:hypothetical protein KFL_003120140 [Klebsormidium nitens]|uniref:DNA primase/polymerase bifunctional N-terminal domain-containing protein n=1 Tax=Klebsormidium nitens TaxID=105231 RepID=A0A1Y1IFC7_KLENI|nr:hypothetical protein KFL_003120140 [Klebsormidium nitens]|eukprot:GAQ86808.1 hypothetical protein KFL_003120140 [Klebsormidium nitens]